MIFWAGSPNSLLSENMASIVAHLERKNRRTGRRFFLREDYCCRPQGRQQGRLSASSSWLLSFSLPLLCNYKVANWAGAPFDRDCLSDLGRSNITSSMLYSKYRNKSGIYNEKMPRTVDNFLIYYFYLRLDDYFKFVLHELRNFLSKLCNVACTGSSPRGNDQRLFLVQPGSSHRQPFNLQNVVQQPCQRHLNSAFGRKLRQTGVFFRQFGGFLRGYYRIKKERTRGPLFFQIRELPRAHREHLCPYFIEVRPCYSGEVFVRGVRRAVFIEFKRRAQNYKSPRLFFKPAGAIPKHAVDIVDARYRAALRIKSFDPYKSVFDFAPVCADVLHRRGTHGAGDA